MEGQDVKSDAVQDKDRGNIAELERQLASNLTITDGKSNNDDIVDIMKVDSDLSVVYDSRWNSSALSLYDSTFDYTEIAIPNAEVETEHTLVMNKVLETLLQGREKENEELKLTIQELQSRLEESGKSFYAENRTVETITTVSVVQAKQIKGNELAVGHNNLTFEEVLKILHSQDKLINDLKKQCNIKQNELSEAEVKFVSIREENQQLKNRLANLQNEMKVLNARCEEVQKENNVVKEELRSCQQSAECLKEENARQTQLIATKDSHLTASLAQSWKTVDDRDNRIKQLKDVAKNLREENSINLKNMKRISDEKIDLIARNADLEKALQEKSSQCETELGKLKAYLADKERVIRETEDVWNDLTMKMQELVNKYPKDNQKLRRSELESIAAFFNLTDVQMVKDVDIYDQTDVLDNDSNSDSVIEVYISNPLRRNKQNYRSRNRDVRSRLSGSGESNRSGSMGRSVRRRSRSRSRSWGRRARSPTSNCHRKKRCLKYRGRSRSRRRPSNSSTWNSERWSCSGSPSISPRRGNSSRSSWRERYSTSPVLVTRRVIARPCGNDRETSSPKPNDNRSPNTSPPSPPLSFNIPSTRGGSPPEVLNWATLSQQYKTGSVSGLSMANNGLLSMSPVIYSKEGNRFSTVVNGNASIPLLLNVGNQGPDNEASPSSFIQKYTISVQKDVPGYHHGKHPVKELDEQSLKRGWALPHYKKTSRVVGSKMHYFCDVKVQKKWYCPEYGSTSPRDAQFLAAMHCLQTLKIAL